MTLDNIKIGNYVKTTVRRKCLKITDIATLESGKRLYVTEDDSVWLESGRSFTAANPILEE